nr:MAG TPA: hypothetical protein [Caudoviricetes sp.]
MQYKFIDIYDSQDEIALPSEAMNFNGKFLENEIHAIQIYRYL